MAINNKKLLDELGVEKLTELLKSYTTNSVNTIKHSLDPPYTIGEIPPITKGIYDFTRANRLMFLPADQIIVEQSIDGGATWTSAEVNDEIKKQVFSQFRSSAFHIPLKNGIRSCDCMIRVTITGMKYNVPAGTAETSKYNYWNDIHAISNERYCSLSGSFFWVCSFGDYIYCKYEAAMGREPNTWGFRGEGWLNGWSGLNYVKIAGTTFGGTTTQPSNLWNHRFTFRTATNQKDFDDSKLQTSSNTSRQQIMEISAFGDNVWIAPNNMMKNNHVYGWDINGNMTLQKGLYTADWIQSGSRVIAPIFYENDIALSNKYAAKADLKEIQDTVGGYQDRFNGFNEIIADIQDTMADYQDQFVAIGQELTKMDVDVNCDHRYEITGNTGDEHGLAIDDQQMIIKKIKGRTLVRNQYVNGNGTCYIYGNEINMPVGEYSSMSQSVNTLVNPIPSNHKVLCIASFTEGYNGSTSGEAAFGGYHRGGGTPNSWQGYVQLPYNTNLSGRTLYSMYTTTDTVTDIWMFLYVGTNITTAVKGYVNYIDLTLAYGVGNEPTTVGEVLSDFPEYVPYDEGTFVHSNNRLISTGRNLWKLEGNPSKVYYNANGSFFQNKITLTSTNNSTITKYIGVHIKLLPNTTYYTSFNIIGSNYNNITVYRQVSSSSGGISLGTDQFGQRIYGVKQQTLEGGIKQFTTGATEDYYFLFYLLTNTPNNSTTTLENFVLSTVSNVTNEPYKEEVIEGVGELKDYDYIDVQSGLLTIGSKVVNMKDLTYENINGGQCIYGAVIPDLKRPSNTSERMTGIKSSYYKTADRAYIDGNMVDQTIVRYEDKIVIRDTRYTYLGAFRQAMQNSSYKVIYELATPTVVEIDNLPAGMPVYKGGVQIQEGTIPYNIEKQYALSIKSQVLQNIETDRVQQNQIEALENFLYQPLDHIGYYAEDHSAVEIRLEQDARINLYKMPSVSEIYLEGHRCILTNLPDDELTIYNGLDPYGDTTVYNYANIPNSCFTWVSKGGISLDGLQSAGIGEIMVEFVNNCFIIRSVFVGGV